LKLLDNVLKT